jgi:hypothetical protein
MTNAFWWVEGEDSLLASLLSGERSRAVFSLADQAASRVRTCHQRRETPNLPYPRCPLHCLVGQVTREHSPFTNYTITFISRCHTARLPADLRRELVRVPLDSKSRSQVSTEVLTVNIHVYSSMKLSGTSKWTYMWFWIVL